MSWSPFLFASYRRRRFTRSSVSPCSNLRMLPPMQEITHPLAADADLSRKRALVAEVDC
jgi:hypothetical protein